MLESAGAHRILTMDLHTGQIQGFFNIPVDNLYATNLILDDIRRNIPNNDNVMIVSPDHGGVPRARALASRLKVAMAIIDKRRPEAGKAEVMNLIGDPAGKDCIMIDDMVDSGGTLCRAAAALKKADALSVHAYATHGVLSEHAITNINNSKLSSMVISDTISHTNVAPTFCNDKQNKVRSFSVAELLGTAITKIRDNQSVSSLFDTH
jgi:ribose-phosphate pyrophosphokinase